MVRFNRFDWDARNVEHIDRHGIEPIEAENACRRDPLILRGHQGRYLAYGRSDEGRYLLLVLASLGGGNVRVITARDMTDRERRFFQQRRR